MGDEANVRKNPIRDAATEYRRRHWKPVPIDRGKKHPTIVKWQQKQFSDNDFTRWHNIGVQFGKPSDGLCDVDLDCNEARALAPSFLPETGAKFGRKSSPAAHWLYVSDIYKTAKGSMTPYDDPEPRENAGEHDARMLELRTGRIENDKDKGALSMFPPSRHPESGELIEWDDNGEPAEIEGATLKRAVAELAVASLLARHWPHEGQRQKGALVVGGVLARAKFNAEYITVFVERVAEVADDDEAEQRGRSAAGAVERLKNGDDTPGFPRLREVMGEKIAKQIWDWLGLSHERSGIGQPQQPQVLLQKRLLADPHSSHDAVMVKELAAWKLQDPVFYEKLLARLKDKGARVGELDRAVKNAIKQDAAKSAAARDRQPPVEQADPEALAESAKHIIEGKDVLGLFAKELAKIYVGEVKNAKRLYLSCTSRLFELRENMHTVVKGVSSGGKSGLISAVTSFMPPESIFRFTSLSNKALFYLPDECDLSHKILIMAEAPKDETEHHNQLLLLRELISEGKISHHVTVKVGDQYVTRTIEVEGSVSFVVSTTKTEGDPELETRLITLEVDDSPDQTKRVMALIAKREGLNRGTTEIDFQPWHDFQRLLGAGERRVYVPFAPEISDLIPPKAVRLRRDFAQLLRAIKVDALLHREHRRRGRTGMIIATLDDYAVVRELMSEPISVSAGVKTRKAIVKTVETIKRLLDEEDPAGSKIREVNGWEGITAQRLADALNICRPSAQRRLSSALKDGYVVNLEDRPGAGRPSRYILSGTVPKGDGLLPTVKAVRDAYELRKRGERQEPEAFKIDPKRGERQDEPEAQQQKRRHGAR